MVALVPLPDAALLTRYRDHPGAFTDCYAVDIAGNVTLADYVAAFYTTPLFRIERWILRLALRRPSTDADAFAVAQGASDTFAVWTVEGRAPDQLLLCDLTNTTRSWFMVAPCETPSKTRLFFGSAVVPRGTNADLGLIFRVLKGFHNFYARALLTLAFRRLAKKT